MSRKRCIFCMQLKKESDFNREHIILESLGGKGENNFCYNVCEECNSNLGRKVDVIISDAAIIKFARFIYKIKGKNGVTNPFSDMPIEYDKSGITGKIETNKNGEIIRFRADYKKYLDKEGNMVLVGPRKNVSGFVKKHFNEFLDKDSDTEIESKLWTIQNPKTPHIEYVEIPEENVNDFLACISLPLLKMAYEYSYTRLGNEYLEDEIAKDIRECIMQFINGKLEINIPTELHIDYVQNEMEKKSEFSFEIEGSKLYVNMSILGFIKSRILISETYDKYKTAQLDTIICD